MTKLTILLLEHFRMNMWTNFLQLSAIYPTKKETHHYDFPH